MKRLFKIFLKSGKTLSVIGHRYNYQRDLLTVYNDKGIALAVFQELAGLTISPIEVVQL